MERDARNLRQEIEELKLEAVEMRYAGLGGVEARKQRGVERCCSSTSKEQ
jgi:hypothetical protein